MKKGFTLVELLAVIVILAVVTLIGTVSVTGVKNRIDKNMFEKKIEFVIVAARNYGNDCKSELTDDSTVTVGKLIEEDYLTTDETDSSNNPSINHYKDGSSINNLNVKVYVQNNRVYACIKTDDANLNLLQDPEQSEFGSLGYYCN